MGIWCCKCQQPTGDIEFIASSTDGNNWMTYTYPANTTIGDLKKKLDASIKGIRTDNMKLTFNGKVLKNDNETMFGAGIVPKSKVIVEPLNE